MYKAYRFITYLSKPALIFVLKNRLKNNKEDPLRFREKQAINSLRRPATPLIWFHAASVGESQSTLILIKRILDAFPNIHILVTTGTLTSAKIMQANLPERAFHQFYPLDHPEWVSKFLDHWHPEMIFWMESELWPNMLHEVKNRNIPALLVNARISDKSFKNWKLFSSLAIKTLSAFSKILCQTTEDQNKFKALGYKQTIVTDNVKHSAHPLPYDKSDFNALYQATIGRPMWLYASTHKGEESIACAMHATLKEIVPDLLTIIVPRHPERRGEIKSICLRQNLNVIMRGEDHTLPEPNTDIYIADTLGELGLFYRLTPIACIGRSFSDDGGGGHNPIEAAQLGCAILHGPHVQNLQEIFDELDSAEAAVHLSSPEHLREVLVTLLNSKEHTQDLQNKALKFSKKKNNIIDVVMNEVTPFLHEAITLNPSNDYSKEHQDNDNENA